jgi:uncharacterized protein (DUF2336 family)
MSAETSLIAELEDALKDGSQTRRVDTLRRVTDLFLNGADRFNDAQIDVFDDVLGHLIKRIETKAMVELSTRLAPVDNAPIEVIRRLAHDDEITIAGPVLTQSGRLSTDDLVDIARTKGQPHLLAISGRRQIAGAVTDVLIARGNHEVFHTLARNTGAQFSENGFASLVKNAETDESLAEKLGLRLDIPIRLLRALLLKATEAVRSKLLEIASPEARNQIQSVIESISNEVAREAAAPRNFDAAKRLIQAMHAKGQLNEAVLFEFVNARKYEEMVAGLAALCSAPIDLVAPLMASERNDSLLIPCKAAGIKWPTVNAILRNRFSHHTISDQAMAKARADYLTLTHASALRILRFWQVRTGVAGKEQVTASANH